MDNNNVDSSIGGMRSGGNGGGCIGLGGHRKQAAQPYE